MSKITNFVQPIIDIWDAKFKNRGELLLSHQYSGVEIKHDYAIETLKCLHRIWNRPVHIETWAEDSKKRITWDGQTSSIDKA